MRRTRRAGRKYQLAKLARALYQTAVAHDSLGTSAPIECNTSDFVSIYGCSCNTVNHADRARCESASTHEEAEAADTKASSHDVNTQNVADCYRPRCRIISDVLLSPAQCLTPPRSPGPVNFCSGSSADHLPTLPRLDDICIEDPLYQANAALREFLLKEYY